MPIMQQLILKVPMFILGLIMVGGTAAFAIMGVLVVRHFIPHGRLKTQHDVAGPILGAIAAVYAVLLAFVVVVVWQGFDKSNANVQLEASCLADLYGDTEAFSPDFRQKACNLLRTYRQAVVDYEWETMARGEMSHEVEILTKQIMSLYMTFQPRTSAEKSFFDESVRRLNSLRDLRRQRLMDAKVGLEPLLWFVLIVGGLSTISFTFLFGAENKKVQIIMAILLSVTISLILFTIMEMDFPFTGDIAISPEPFKMLLLD